MDTGWLREPDDPVTLPSAGLAGKSAGSNPIFRGTERLWRPQARQLDSDQISSAISLEGSHMVNRVQARPFATLFTALLLFHSTDFTCSAGTDAFAPGAGIRVSGTVRFVSVEAGCWQFQAQNGARYELRPTQAPSRVLVDGAQAVLVVRLRTDLVTVCMVGDVVDVERVESVHAP
jgi:hypothetical protein